MKGSGWVILCLACLFAIEAKAQQTMEFDDLLVTMEGDSIRGRIGMNSKSFFTIEQPDSLSRLFPAAAVRTVRYGYYTPLASSTHSKDKKPGGTLRFHANFGFSALIEGEIDDEERYRNAKVRTGYNFSVAPTYVFPSREFAVGVAGDLRKHTAGDWDLNTYYIGPLFVLNLPNGKDFGLIDFSVGYINYREENGSAYYAVNQPAARMGGGYVFNLSNGIGLEIRLTVLGATYKKAKTNTGWRIRHRHAQSISSVNLSVGLVFGK